MCLLKAFLALFVYRLLIVILLPLLLVLLLLRSRSQIAYRQRLGERLGFIANTLKKDSIVIHAASVGEVIAIRPLVNDLLQQQPSQLITITTFTPTGSEQVVKLFANEITQGKVQHCYLALDHVFCSAIFLAKLQPKAMIFMETELWPNMVQQCYQKNIKLLLINGRLSDKSVRQYQKVRALIAPTLQKFNLLLLQSDDYMKRYIALGANPRCCENTGNIKFDITLTEKLQQQVRELQSFLPDRKTHSNKQVWLIASSHEVEEALLLSAVTQLKKSFPDLLIIWAPRHPERFQACSKLFENAGFVLNKRSEQTPLAENTDIWLFDTLGELNAAYALATVVTVAGSFCAVGGHNPLEAALFKKPIVVGANMASFNEIQQQLLTENGIIQLAQNSSEILAKTVIALLNDEEHCQRLGENAYHVVQSNQGAVEKTARRIQQQTLSA